MIKEILHRFKWLILLASCLSAISAIAGIAMISIVTDMVASLEHGKLDAAQSFPLFVLAVMVVMAFGVLSQYILLRLSSVVVFDTQKSLLERFLATDYERIERIGGHRIMATMEGDVSALARGSALLPAFTYSFITVILCLMYMLYSSWELFLFVALVVALIIAGAKVMLNRAMIHQSALRACMDSFFRGLQALTNGGKELSASPERRRHFYFSVMLPLFNDIRKTTVKSEILYISAGSFASTLVFFLVGSVVFGASYFVPGVKAEVVVSFVLVILYVVEPLNNVVNISGEFNEVRVALNNISRLDLAGADKFSLPVGSREVAGIKRNKIQFESVFFKYESVEGGDGYDFSVGPLSTEMRAGEITFVTGGNGSGKSTFVKLLVGLYRPKSGRIFVDEMLVGEDLSVEDYKSSISVIFSDFFLFNQLLDDEGVAADDKAISNHLKRLELDKKVRSRDGVLSSPDLSQGQKKRLALLQSYLHDAAICVYDEWAADQDPRFKHYFYCDLLPELKRQGKIIVIISHDDRYFQLADQVIRLDEGELVSI